MGHAQKIWRMAALYAAATFFAGFGLGVIRVLIVTPLAGPMAAVLLELPIMLWVSWVVCGAVLAQPWTVHRTADRATMGAVAFVLLMVLEAALAILVLRRPPGAFFADFATPPGLLGLAGQMLFGLIPLAPTMAAAQADRTAQT